MASVSAESSGRSKLGLALSGGGFRASFFHIGVLARLAETGLLRQVEVLSTVSGGSIIGALYYVWLKALLESVPEDRISDAHLADMVRAIQKQFLEGVQRNIRCLALANLGKNLRMMRRDYSISDRLGELYDEIFYRPALDRFADFARDCLKIAVKPDDLKKSFGLEPGRLLEMRRLKIVPKGGRPDFHPERHNQDRSAKVPILLLNATCLNTGHNWRFEAARMGEPSLRDAVSLGVDKHWRLLKADAYDDLQPEYQNLELGFAVAASACVPGVFTPLALSTLYAGGLVVQLVDGGVHDNQGVEALAQADCTHLVISDASGQMNDEQSPWVAWAPTLLRAKSIMEDRLRQTQLHDALHDYGDRAACLHLKSGLPIREWRWRSEADKRGASSAALFADAPRRDLGIDPAAQDLLSRVRTDLDSFSDIEAHSLMADGYLLGQAALEQADGVVALMTDPEAPAGTWEFLRVAPWMARPTPQYLKHLRVAASQAFKVFQLDWMRAVREQPWVVLAALAFALGLAALLWRLAWSEPVSLRWTTYLVLGLLVLPVAAGFKPLRFVLKDCLARGALAGLRGALDVVKSAAFTLHLRTLDPLFLRMGRIAELKDPPAAAPDTPPAAE